MILSILCRMGGGNLLADYQRYTALRKASFVKLFLRFPEFRYQLYYRLRAKSKIWKLILTPLKVFNSLNLYINCPDIDGGLFIEHGFSTIISCRHIGKNCWINQQVTIGYSDSAHSPYIGNDVSVKAGAKVIGDVTIGDDVIIGAGAVVVKDVPSHSIVAGVPAQIIKYRKSKNTNWIKYEKGGDCSL